MSLKTKQARALAMSAMLPALLAPAVVMAHGGDAVHSHGAWQAFAAGFAHPFTGFDHLVALLALGAWSALALQRAWVVPAAFTAAMAGGVLLGGAGFVLPMVEPMIAASLLVFGLLLTRRAALPLAVGVSVAVLFAVFHGVAHGQELASGFTKAPLIGLLTASVLLQGLGLGLGNALAGWGRWPARAAGGAAAAFGAVLLLPALAAVVR